MTDQNYRAAPRKKEIFGTAKSPHVFGRMIQTAQIQVTGFWKGRTRAKGLVFFGEIPSPAAGLLAEALGGAHQPVLLRYFAHRGPGTKAANVSEIQKPMNH